MKMMIYWSKYNW